jgi:hypothetical protein
MASAISSTGVTGTLKVSGRETAGRSSISMMENRVLRRYQGEARRRGSFALVKCIWKYCKYSIKLNIAGEYTYALRI